MSGGAIRVVLGPVVGEIVAAGAEVVIHDGFTKLKRFSIVYYANTEIHRNQPGTR